VVVARSVDLTLLGAAAAHPIAEAFDRAGYWLPDLTVGLKG
jgi:hypothetical protein